MERVGIVHTVQAVDMGCGCSLILEWLRDRETHAEYLKVRDSVSCPRPDIEWCFAVNAASIPLTIKIILGIMGDMSYIDDEHRLIGPNLRRGGRYIIWSHVRLPYETNYNVSFSVWDETKHPEQLYAALVAFASTSSSDAHSSNT